MKRLVSPRALLWFATSFVLAALALSAGGRIGAQEKKEKGKELTYSFEVVVEKQSRNIGETDAILLRPNHTQNVYLKVKHSRNLDRKITLQLFRVPIEGAKTLLATAADITVKSGVSTPIPTWTTAILPAPVGAAPVPAPAPPELERKDYSPFLLELSVLEKENNKDTVVQTTRIPIRCLEPVEYVNEPTTDFAADGLKMTVVSNDSFSKPNAPIALELSKEYIPGIESPVTTSGNIRDVLTARNQSKVLFANKLRFQPDAAKTGIVHLSVDGCDHAFSFATNFMGQGDALTGAQLHLNAAKYQKVSDSIRVKVEANAGQGARWYQQVLRVGIDRNANKQIDDDELVELRGTRDEHLLFLPPATDGALVFRTIVRDWLVEIPTTGLIGEWSLVATMRRGNQENPIIKDESKNLIFDSTPPENVRFIAPVAPIPFTGKPVIVSATGEDPESGIEEVRFFLGRPTPDGKIPPLSVKGQRAKKTNPWTAPLDLPPDAKGRIPVGVQFTNGAGMTTLAEYTIELVSPEAKTQANKGGRIKVTLLEGDRRQNGFDVQMLDPRTKQVKRTQKTAPPPPAPVKKSRERDSEPQLLIEPLEEGCGGCPSAPSRIPGGETVFENIPPGTYTFRAAKSSSSSKAEKTVVIQEGENEPLTLKLYR